MVSAEGNEIFVSLSPTCDKVSPISTESLKVESPVTVNASSIVVVHPAESIVKFPDDVSISLSPVTPI